MIYVNMTDKCLSGWGHAAGGLSYFCVKCDNWDQAEAIKKAAEDRSEMRRIDFADRPRTRRGSHTRVKHYDELHDSWKKYAPKTATVGGDHDNQI